MSIGIYALYFEQDDSKVYIGQSTKIESRYKDHCNLLSHGKHHSYKLQDAYNMYLNNPTLVLLQQCKIEELDYLEEQFVVEFNSLKAGYNIINAGPSGRGYTASKSIYSRELLLQVAELLTDPTLSNKDIAARLNVKVSLVETIAYNKRHHWIGEEFPEIRRQIDSIIKSNQKFKSSNNINKRNNIVHHIISPTGISYYIHNISEFAAEHLLNRSHLCQVLKGNVSHHKHWKKGGSTNEQHISN